MINNEVFSRFLWSQRVRVYFVTFASPVCCHYMTAPINQ